MNDARGAFPILGDYEAKESVPRIVDVRSGKLDANDGLPVPSFLSSGAHIFCLDRSTPRSNWSFHQATPKFLIDAD